MHTAFRRETGARMTVLMVHGIMGSPDQFRFLADAIESKPQLDYSCVLLPGHGGSIRDFASARAADWKQFIHETVCELRSRHEKLIFVGHSMGCLLGLIENERAPLDGMLLISCPLRLRASLRYPIAGARSILEEHPENPRVTAAKAANSVHARTPIEYLRIAPPYIELLRLIREARGIAGNAHGIAENDRGIAGNAHGIAGNAENDRGSAGNARGAAENARGIAIFSDDDEIVSPRSAEFLSGFSILSAPDSGHFLYSPAAQAAIAESLFKLIEPSTAVDIELTQR